MILRILNFSKEFYLLFRVKNKNSTPYNITVDKQINYEHIYIVYNMIILSTYLFKSRFDCIHYSPSMIHFIFTVIQHVQCGTVQSHIISKPL